jgi:O-antigen ligase
MTVTPTYAPRRPARPTSALVVPAAVGVCGGVATGVAVTVDLRIGILLALAAVAVPVALIDVPLAAAIWVALGLVAGLPAFGLATTGAGLLLLVAWLVWLPAERARVAAAIRLHRQLLVCVALLLGWLTLSLAWARDPEVAALELGRWCMAAAALLVLVTSARTERDVRLIIGALIAGTLLSVLIGVAGGSLGAPDTSVETATSTEGRLQGGADDPNFLAAYIVPVVVLAAVLRPRLAGLARPLISVSAAVLVAGLFATQSRGGMLAAVAAVLAALVLLPGRRLVVGACAVVLALGAVAYFVAEPSALERLTTAAADRGNGREDLWRVAGRMTADHPVAGVGLDNFRVRSAEYVREPGTLRFVDLIVDKPHEVHNTYLQLLAENGVIGLTLFIAVVGAAMASALRAARRFEAVGALTLAGLARGVLVADIAFLAAAVFLSAGSRPTLWVLLAIGPLLLALAPRG